MLQGETETSRMKYMKSILVIAIFSVIGSIQAILLIGGVIFFSSFEFPHPILQILFTDFGKFMPLIALLWPVYAIQFGLEHNRKMWKELHRLRKITTDQRGKR